MTPEQQNFEALRRLLALKRHEPPPPGYFNSFSAQVIVRIRTSQLRDQESVSWLHRLWAMVEAKPILSGAFGVAVCSLVISSIGYSDQTESKPVELVPLAQNHATAPAQVADGRPVNTLPVRALLDQTPPVEAAAQQPLPSLFEEYKGMQKSWVVPASLNVIGGN